MKVAYLMNTYPVTSSTFIRREIEALEELGLPIERYAVRRWSESLVDPRDNLEQEKTHYLLAGNARGLILASIEEFCRNPIGVFRALCVWAKLILNAGGGLVKHIAYFMQAAYFRRLARLRRIDHVHVHFATNATSVAMLSYLMGGPTYSFTVHGPDELVDLPGVSVNLKIAHAAFVVVISEFCKQKLLLSTEGQYAEKLFVGRCGLALEEFENLENENNSDSQTFVCVGRLCPQKGQVLLPAAAAKLRARFPNLKIVLVGDGESRSAILSAIALHKVDDMVSLLGWRSNQEVLKLIRSSRSLVLPSFAEGLPVVIMESLALRRPVISTLIAGIPELVDESCGWLFPAGDESELVTAFRKALECTSSELAAKGEAGRARVFKLHDRRVLAKLLYTLFQSTSAKPNGVEHRREKVAAF